MKANELMIGDWVKIDDSFGQVLDIDQREKYAIVGVGFNEGGYDVYNDDELKPIPITSEILKKNGFKEVSPDIYWPESRYRWCGNFGRNQTFISIAFYDKPVNGVKMLTKIETDCSHDSGINAIHNCDIEFVHQLQHALRICGIEKTIEL